MEKLRNKEKNTSKLNKKLQNINRNNVKYLDQEQVGYIIPDEGEQTNKFDQDLIKTLVPNYNIKNSFDLNLPKGPFLIDFSLNGNKLLISGRSSAAVLNWKTKTSLCQVDLEEKQKISSVKFMNNDMFAMSLENELCIYDNQGIELHNLNQFSKPKFIEHLPYHYLLTWSTKNK